MPSHDDNLAAAGYKFRLNVTQSSQNVANNTSVIAWSVQLLKGSGSGKYAGGPHYWSVLIDGQYRDGSIGSYDFTQYSTLTLGSGSMTIAHNSDGTKTVSGQAGFDDNNTYGEIGDGQVGPGPLISLTTIPRATTPSFPSNMTMGSPYTISLPRASSSFTHTVQYYFGTTGWVNIATGAGASVSWTPPISLASEMPNNITGNGTIRVLTYSGSTHIGTVGKPMNLTIPASVVPTFTTVTHSEAESGVATNVGAYVEGLSRLNLAITGATGVYGSTISSYKITAAGQTINAASGTTASIAANGTVPLVGTITDSRGRTATQTVNITVLPWSVPMITSSSTQRSTPAGVVDTNGTSIRLDLTANVASLINGTQKNNIEVRVYTRMRGNSTWNSVLGPMTVGYTTSGGRLHFTGMLLPSGTYAITNAWEVRVDVSDDFATTSVISTVATASIDVHFDANTGVGIGKFRENGKLDVAGSIYERGGLVSPVGILMPYAGSTAPAGWLICDGAAVSRVTYADLFAVISTTYGAGNGTTTFNLPNLKGRIPVGIDAAQTEFNLRGETGGSKTETLTVDQLPAHSHPDIYVDSTKLGWGAYGVSSGGTKGVPNATASSNTIKTGDTGANEAHNNLQPYMALHYIIRF